jgi:hypothetical protein
LKLQLSRASQIYLIEQETRNSNRPVSISFSLASENPWICAPPQSNPCIWDPILPENGIPGGELDIPIVMVFLKMLELRSIKSAYRVINMSTAGPSWSGQPLAMPLSYPRRKLVPGDQVIIGFFAETFQINKRDVKVIAGHQRFNFPSQYPSCAVLDGSSFHLNINGSAPVGRGPRRSPQMTRLCSSKVTRFGNAT